MLHGTLIAPDESQFGASPSKFAGISAGPATAQGDVVVIPDAHLLFNCEFKRVGDDLKLVGDDGRSYTVQDYFKAGKHPTLVTPEGAQFPGSMVEGLAGSHTQYAQAGAQPGTAETIGKVATVTGNATIVRNGVAVTVNSGDVVLKNDVLRTGGDGALGVTFNDGTTFSLSANAQMSVNEFVYQDGGANNQAVFNLVRGSISFFASQVAKTGDMKVSTPTATMGIRGTTVVVDIVVNTQTGNIGQVKIKLYADANGHVGRVEVFSTTGTLLGTLTASATGFVINPGQTDANAEQINQQEAARDLGLLQVLFNSTDIGNQLLQNQNSNPNTNGSGSGSSTDPNVIVTFKQTENPDGTTTTTVDNVVFVPPQPADPTPPSGGGGGGSVVPDETGAPAPAALAANPDSASMTENQITFVDALANDSSGTANPGTLQSLGEIEIEGPDGVTLGTPAIVIENGQVRITPGTAFDALAEGETATITIPYTMVNELGETVSSVVTVAVTGTNDAPYFTVLPDNVQTIGSVTIDSEFGGTDAIQLVTDGASVAQIEYFLGLQAGTLAALSAATSPGGALPAPTDGAAIAFDLVLAEGETVTFTWNFASTEYEPYNDFAFFSFAPSFGEKLADIFAIGDSAADGVLHSSGWQEYTFTADDDGNYRLGIGVVNTGDTAVDSFLYISGFSGLGFKRTTTEDGDLETFNLLNGAYDVDTHDVLTAIYGSAVGHDQDGNVVDIAGALVVNGNNVTIDPTFFDYLAEGDTVTIVISYGVSDGHTVSNNTATLVVEGEDESTVTATVDTSHGFDMTSIVDGIVDGDLIDIADDGTITLQFGDLTYLVSTSGLTFTGDPGEDDVTLTGGKLTGLHILDDEASLFHATGFNISAVAMQGAVDEFDEDGDTDGVEALLGNHFFHITGKTGADILVGSLYDDFIDGRGGADSIEGGDGDDTIIVYDPAGASITWNVNGGEGIDKLRLDGSFNLLGDNDSPEGGIVEATRIEIIDLGLPGSDSLAIDVTNIEKINQGSELGALRVLGSAQDAIFLSPFFAGWSKVEMGVSFDQMDDHTDGVTFDHYSFEGDNGSISVYVQQGMFVLGAA